MQDLIKNVNLFMENHNAPHISESDDLIEKSECYVEMNNWLKTAEKTVLEELIDEYGLLIPVITLTGLNLDHVTILQAQTNVNYSGYVRYIDMLLTQVTQKKVSKLRKLASPLLDDANELTKTELRSKMIATIIERYINLQVTNKDALLDLASLVA